MSATPPRGTPLLGVPIGPPEINRRNKGRAVSTLISSSERERVNSSMPPPVDWMDYTPEVNDSRVLVNTMRSFDYKDAAIKQMANAWAEYCMDKTNCDEVTKSECKKYGVNYSIFKSRITKSGGKRKTRRMRKNSTAKNHGKITTLYRKNVVGK